MQTHQGFSTFFLINRLVSKCSDNWNRLNLDNRFVLRLLQKYVWILICLAVYWHLKVMLSSSSGAHLQGVKNTICLGSLHVWFLTCCFRCSCLVSSIALISHKNSGILSFAYIYGKKKVLSSNMRQVKLFFASPMLTYRKKRWFLFFLMLCWAM